MFENIKSKIKDFSRDAKDDVYAAFLAYKDPRTPLLAKILVLFIIGYFLSPIDLIPDFIPVLGYLDDAIIIPFLLMIAKSMMPQEVWIDCRRKASKTLPKLKILSYSFTAVIIFIWLAISYFLVKPILKAV